MQFYTTTPTSEALWRAIILFGRNVASYKFALGKALLEVAQTGNDFIALEDLAPRYTAELCAHLQSNEVQGTFRQSAFLAACASFNRGEIEHDELIDVTLKRGFQYVIDAFHVVNQDEIPQRFFLDERKMRGGLALTDTLLAMVETPQFAQLSHEVEARWNLVETAWKLRTSPRLLVVERDVATQRLYVVDKVRRVDVTSCRDALSGYQKGTCFYSNASISLDPNSPLLCDVDHFFPHTLKQVPDFAHINIDGVWNLVLARQECNRGKNGKFARLPSLRMLEKLHTRNEYFIESHHPLRETIINQTGTTLRERRAFLQEVYSRGKQVLIHEWMPDFIDATL